MKCITHTSKCDFKCCFKLPNIIISFFRLGLHRESQTLLGTVRYGSNGVGVANLIENTLLRHVCYRTTFCRFRSNCMGHNKLWGRWERGPSVPREGTQLTPRNMFHFHICYPAKFVHSRSDCSSLIMEIWRKILTRRWKWHGPISHLWLPVTVPW